MNTNYEQLINNEFIPLRVRIGEERKVTKHDKRSWYICLYMCLIKTMETYDH
jgi:hypothetical protein